MRTPLLVLGSAALALGVGAGGPATTGGGPPPVPGLAVDGGDSRPAGEERLTFLRPRTASRRTLQHRTRADAARLAGAVRRAGDRPAVRH